MPDQNIELAARPDYNFLPGRCALVTGASSGIGHEVARRLARAGAAVVINYHSHAQPAENLAAEITSAGGKAFAFGGDVSDEIQAKKLFEETLSALGGLDIVVTNSGLHKDAAISNMTLTDWNEVIGVNLTGQFLCCREAIAIFRAQVNKPSASRGAALSA